MSKPSEFCEICKKVEHTRLCDFATGTGIVTSVNFQELTKTCDRRMCNGCATGLWANCEVCPEHASVVKIRLSKGLIQNGN